MEHSEPKSNQCSITGLEKLGYVLVLPVGLCIQFIVFIFSTDDCHGAGAAHPGGCVAFTRTWEWTSLLFFIVEVLVIVWILFGRVHMGHKGRIALFSFFSFAVLVGYILLELMLEPLKLL